MGRQGSYPAEVRERAVRLVMEPQETHDSQWAAISSIAAKMGYTAETLRQWVRRAERDSGALGGRRGQERVSSAKARLLSQVSRSLEQRPTSRVRCRQVARSD